jgi:hypothetical protein
MTLQFKRPILYTDVSRMADRSGAGACGVRPVKMLSFSHDVHATVFQAEVFVILTCATKCTGMAFSGEHIYICLDSQAALQALKAKRVTLKLVWKC